MYKGEEENLSAHKTDDVGCDDENTGEKSEFVDLELGESGGELEHAFFSFHLSRVELFAHQSPEISYSREQNAGHCQRNQEAQPLLGVCSVASFKNQIYCENILAYFQSVDHHGDEQEFGEGRRPGSFSRFQH